MKILHYEIINKDQKDKIIRGYKKIIDFLEVKLISGCLEKNYKPSKITLFIITIIRQIPALLRGKIINIIGFIFFIIAVYLLYQYKQEFLSIYNNNKKTILLLSPFIFLLFSVSFKFKKENLSSFLVFRCLICSVVRRQ